MAATAAPGKAHAKPKTGLHVWMERVLEECDRAGAEFEADPVHDLRVAIRRCRSMADGLMAIDPDPAWKDMKRAGKKLFAALGTLREMQVMEEWIEKLVPAEDGVRQALLAHAKGQEAQLKQAAQDELSRFDRKQWRQWSSSLPARAGVVRLGSIVFEHLALERWTEAHEMHRRATRSWSGAALHQARIGIKRFRYTVENFLPAQHAAWAKDLKEMQDLLGEIHDLDVLWGMATQLKVFTDEKDRSRWHERILEERTQRLTRYREQMLGRQSLWHEWRSKLPQGEQIRAGALLRFKVWAGFLDKDSAHTQRITELALELLQGLAAHGLVSSKHEGDLALILQVGALAQNVGSTDGHAKPKTSAKKLRKFHVPLGWSSRELAVATAVVRCHHGRSPKSTDKPMHRLERADRRTVVLLGGILRLVNAIEGRRGRVNRLMVEIRRGQLYVYAHGYSNAPATGEEVAASRYLLESALRRSILVRPSRGPAKTRRPSLLHMATAH